MASLVLWRHVRIEEIHRGWFQGGWSLVLPLRPVVFLVLSVFVEFIGLRFLLRQVNSFRVGFVGFTDYDVVPPFCFALFGWIWALVAHRPLQLRLHRKEAILHGLCLTVFLAFCVGIAHFGMNRGSLGYWIWLVACVLTMATLIPVFTGLEYLGSHPRLGLVVPATLVGFSKLAGVTLFAAWWEPVAQATAFLSGRILSLFIVGLEFQLRVVGDARYWQIIHPSYVISVGRGCSGLEGIFFFISLWAFLFLVGSHRYSSKHWLYFGVMGIAGMYILNLGRICLFYGVALFVVELFGAQAAVSTSLLLFHNGVGWVLYTAALYYFYGYAEAISLRDLYSPKWKLAWSS